MKDPAVTTLAAHPFFADWSQDELALLCERCTRSVYNVGEALWRAGEPGEEAFILLSGRVERTQLVRPDGQRAEHYDAPGSLISIATLAQPCEHTSSGTPLERSEVLVLKRQTFMDLFEQEHAVAYRLVDAIAANLVDELRDTNRRLHKVFGQPAETLRMLRRRMRETSS